MVILERNVGGPLWHALRYSFVSADSRKILTVLHVIAGVTFTLVALMIGIVLLTGATTAGILRILLGVTVLLAGLSWWAAVAVPRRAPASRLASALASLAALPIFFLGTIAGIYGLVLLRRLKLESSP